MLVVVHSSQYVAASCTSLCANLNVPRRLFQLEVVPMKHVVAQWTPLVPGFRVSQAVG